MKGTNLNALRNRWLPVLLRVLAFYGVLALALVLANLAASAPVGVAGARLAEAEAAYDNATSALAAGTPPRALTRGLPQVDLPAPPTLPEMPRATVALMDLRIPLAHLAQAAGANGQLAVLQAQSAERPEAIVIQNGQIDLAGLMAAIAGLPGGAALVGPQGLTRPLVIWRGARLEMAPGDRLPLSRPDGAFLANFGALLMTDAAIAGQGPLNAQSPDFAPFLVTAGSGHAQIDGAVLQALGFGLAPAFSGVAFIKGGLYPADAPSVVQRSLISDVAAVTLAGLDAPVIARSIIQGTRRQGLELRATKSAIVAGNLFLDIGAGNAIRITHGAKGTHVMENRLLKGAGTGIHIETLSNSTRIAGNVIWATKGGIAVRRSDCLTVVGNSILGTQGKGLSLRTVRAAVIEGNAFVGAKSAAIFVAEQPPQTETRVTANTFAANRVGLTAASGDRLVLAGNDLTEQFPRFFDGDLAQMTPLILGDLTGAATLDLIGTPTPPLALPPLNCTPETKG